MWLPVVCLLYWEKQLCDYFSFISYGIVLIVLCFIARKHWIGLLEFSFYLAHCVMKNRWHWTIIITDLNHNTWYGPWESFQCIQLFTIISDEFLTIEILQLVNCAENRNFLTNNLESEIIETHRTSNGDTYRIKKNSIRYIYLNLHFQRTYIILKNILFPSRIIFKSISALLQRKPIIDIYLL